ncbi:MAG: 4-vinyl reductase, partial [Alphaproteobacteria bacterium]
MQPKFDDQYAFAWSDLGDIALGRPNLGPDVPVVVYRLAQYTMREAIRRRYGEEVAMLILRESGWISGREFCLNVLDTSLDFKAFIVHLQETLKNEKIGIMRLEKADMDNMSFVLTVSEDLDCSG